MIMELLPSEIEIPPFKQYYPSIDSLDQAQSKFYDYWKTEFEAGRPRTADTSYIFIYIYQLFREFSEKKKSEVALMRLKSLSRLYSDQVGLHVDGWLSDAYLAKGEFEEAYRLYSKHQQLYRIDNQWLNLKYRLGKDLDAKDIRGIAKTLGFQAGAVFKRHEDEVASMIEDYLNIERREGMILQQIVSFPYTRKVKEYLYSGFSGNPRTVELIDFLGQSFLPELSVNICLKVSDEMQAKHGRKRNTQKPDASKKRTNLAIWELKTKDPFVNPDSVNARAKCNHSYLRLENHWDTYRKYGCIDCNAVFMCECEKRIASVIRPYQVKGGWANGICPKCRGLDDVSMVTDGKLMYGSTFKAIHWREIAFEADRLAIENGDEFGDYGRAENNIRQKYGVPLIGEGWISETTLYKNLQELFPEIEVIHHGKPKWLGRMHLDVYIPSLNVAFEYQGKQHYTAVEYFGGHEALEKTKSRDAEKARLCEENGLTLFYIHDGEDFSIPTLKKFLSKVLSEI